MTLIRVFYIHSPCPPLFLRYEYQDVDVDGCRILRARGSTRSILMPYNASHCAMQGYKYVYATMGMLCIPHGTDDIMLSELAIVSKFFDPSNYAICMCVYAICAILDGRSMDSVHETLFLPLFSVCLLNIYFFLLEMTVF